MSTFIHIFIDLPMSRMWYSFFFFLRGWEWTLASVSTVLRPAIVFDVPSFLYAFDVCVRIFFLGIPQYFLWAWRRNENMYSSTEMIRQKLKTSYKVRNEMEKKGKKRWKTQKLRYLPLFFYHFILCVCVSVERTIRRTNWWNPERKKQKNK